MLVIPGGGIEAGESKLQAVMREIFEETGIDITGATITRLDNVATGESKKTLKDANEVVLMKMEFYDFTVRLHEEASAVSLRFNDDFGDAQWYVADELENAQIGPNTKLTLQKLGFL
ncbi:MAG TPA: NUDIX hydrolase [Candidatus Saccharimonadales bacterium]|nr:NUDIX hydrolase [Candidatus Saccharimonadales bacterium]